MVCRRRVGHRRGRDGRRVEAKVEFHRHHSSRRTPRSVSAVPARRSTLSSTAPDGSGCPMRTGTGSPARPGTTMVSLSRKATRTSAARRLPAQAASGGGGALTTGTSGAAARTAGTGSGRRADRLARRALPASSSEPGSRCRTTAGARAPTRTPAGTSAGSRRAGTARAGAAANGVADGRVGDSAGAGVATGVATGEASEGSAGAGRSDDVAAATPSAVAVWNGTAGNSVVVMPKADSQAGGTAGAANEACWTRPNSTQPQQADTSSPHAQATGQCAPCSQDRAAGTHGNDGPGACRQAPPRAGTGVARPDTRHGGPCTLAPRRTCTSYTSWQADKLFLHRKAPCAGDGPPHFAAARNEHGAQGQRAPSIHHR